MTGARVESQPKCWRVDGHPISIQYLDPVLEQIRLAAEEGFQRLAHGGVEIGGVLYGRHDGDSVHIFALRPAACEHALGPGFVLSENDLAALRKLLEEAAQDPELSDLEPVGWYHSHNRSEINLTDRDVEIYERFFPERWQIALVVKPARFQPTRAGFFFRERDGGIHREYSYKEFVLERMPLPSPERRNGGAAVEPARTEAPASPPAVLEPAPSLEPAAPPASAAGPARRRSPLLWLWIALPLCVVVVGAGLINTYLLSNRDAGLALQVTDAAGQLRIQWDRRAQPIREATGGLLEIHDGSETVEILFDGNRLRRGSVTYARRSEKVDVRLRVNRESGQPAEELVQFLGPPVAAAAPPPAETPKPEPPAAPNPADQVKAEPVKAPAVLGRFQPPVTPRRSAQVVSPPPGPPVQTATVPLPQNPAVPLLPGPQAVAPPPPPRETLRPKPAETPPPKPRYTGPSAGRIIWAGQLPPGGQVSIDGRRCSRGSVNGELPGVPVRIRVYPADLSSKGITVFTADPQAGATEAPSARNGWNRTTYTWDRRRANDVIVLESPSAANNWKGMLLRGDREGTSLIVIDWQVAQ